MLQIIVKSMQNRIFQEIDLKVHNLETGENLGCICKQATFLPLPQVWQKSRIVFYKDTEPSAPLTDVLNVLQKMLDEKYPQGGRIEQISKAAAAGRARRALKEAGLDITVLREVRGIAVP